MQRLNHVRYLILVVREHELLEYLVSRSIELIMPLVKSYKLANENAANISRSTSLETTNDNKQQTWRLRYSNVG